MSLIDDIQHVVINVIGTIGEFKLRYDGSDVFIRDNKLSDVVLEYYVNNYKVNWTYISAYQTLSETFIDKYIDKIWWYYVSSYQTLSESLIIKHIDRVTWWNISAYQTLSESFITKYSNKVKWVRLFKNKKITLSYDILVKHLYDFNLYEVSIGIENNDNVNRLVKKFPDKYQIDKLEYEFNRNN